MISDFATDLRNACRTLRKNPGFTFTALVTLALAIGANSAIFTLANALLLASLPVSHPDRLFEVSTVDPKGEKGNLSIPAFQLIQLEAHVFTSALAWRGGAVQNLEMNGMPFVGLVDRILLRMSGRREMFAVDSAREKMNIGVLIALRAK